MLDGVFVALADPTRRAVIQTRGKAGRRWVSWPSGRRCEPEVDLTAERIIAAARPSVWGRPGLLEGKR